MFGLGTQELVVILLIAFLIFGGKKLPEIGAGLGKALSAFKRGLREAEEDVQKPMAETTASKPVEHSSEGAAQKTP